MNNPARTLVGSVFLIMLCILFFMAKNAKNKTAQVQQNLTKVADINTTESQEQITDLNTLPPQVIAPDTVAERNKTDKFIKSCASKDDDSCNTLGRLYKHGIGVEQDFVKSSYYYNISCNLNNGDACDNLGTFFKEGKGIAKDNLEAIRYFERACDLNESISCYQLANLYEKEQGKALKFYKKACKLNVEKGCDKYKDLRDE